MQEVILLLSVLAVFILGYFLMGRLDTFLIENRRAIEKAHEKEKPSCVILTDELTAEEILNEIRQFRDHHEETKILLVDSTRCPLSETDKQFVDPKR